MKIEKEDPIYRGKAERIWVGMKKVDFFVRHFEIRCELQTGAGIGLIFSDKSFRTYNTTPSYFLGFLKQLAKEVEKYET